MKSYYALGNKMFRVAEAESEAPLGEEVRLKVSQILVTSADVAIFDGKLNINYPRIPCRFATAVMSEDRDDLGLKLGSRVLINPYIELIADKNDALASERIYGLHEDGLLRDFITLPAEAITPFPENVKENEALFADVVAVALKVLSSFQLRKGDYIAIVGSSVLAVVVAELALYYQTIPVLITSDDRITQLAESVGIYYIVNETHENVKQRMMLITGGRMANHTVLHCLPDVTPDFLAMLTTEGGDCVIAGLDDAHIPILSADIGQIAAKNLVVRGVTNGKSEYNAAINLLAQKILRFDGFIDKTVEFSGVQGLFEELSQDGRRYLAPVIKV